MDLLFERTTLIKQRQFFAKGMTKDVPYRIEQLHKLKEMIQKYENEVISALQKDLRKSEYESYMTEIGFLIEEINFVLKHMKEWTKPEKVKTPVTHIGSSSYIYSMPYGVSLIIAPWNYPFQLQLAPLVGAIAAGNCAILKPSELTPTVSSVIKKMVSSTFDEEYIAVVEGDVEVSTALLQEKFDKIFFTGSVSVGQIVMEAAAKHLTPVTLELGGKSPCIVDHDAKIDKAAKRIVWGKYTNAGQTCVAPDYLLVHSKVKAKLLTKMKKYIKEFYGKNPLESDAYTRIVSERHYDRLSTFLSNGQVVVGGACNRALLSIEPTILDDITWEDPVMKEEIFGPILPIIEFEDLSEVVDHVNHHPNPLALYYFSESKTSQEHIIHSIAFGGGAINDTLYHLANPYLPFGGIGNSGIGSYHGKSSFDVFSHKKSILKQSTNFDISVRYPTSDKGMKLLKKMHKK